MSDESPSKSLRLKLSATDAEIVAKFHDLQSVSDVADLLELPERQLTYAIWRTPELRRYRTWSIRKRNGGVRTIDAPRKTHKILQTKLAYVLELVAQRRTAAHGFSPGKSIVTNAREHSRNRWVLNVDLEDFFPSIHFGRVRGMLMASPYNVGERAATAIAQLCCHAKRLPQGAPTSPVLSNMICTRLDGEMRRLAKSLGCKYTRYADDLTFSTNKRVFPSELAIPSIDESPDVVGHALLNAIKTNGFKINAEKVRLQRNTTRQEVTGLVVNRRPNVRRSFLNQLRSMLHAWEHYGFDAAQSEFLAKYDSKHRPKDTSDRVYERVIRGKLAFLKQVRGGNDARYITLRRRLDVLTGDIKDTACEELEMEYDVFICHASEDKSSVADPLTRALVNADVRVWIDSERIRWGDSITNEINNGLSKSKFVILILSPRFMKKRWPVKEMNSILSIEISTGVTRALPLLVGNAAQRKSILNAYPLLADKRHEEWSASDTGAIVSAIKSLLARTS